MNNQKDKKRKTELESSIRYWLSSLGGFLQLILEIQHGLNIL